MAGEVFGYIREVMHQLSTEKRMERHCFLRLLASRAFRMGNCYWGKIAEIPNMHGGLLLILIWT